MLSRRGLFGFLAAAPVVAPAIAKELAQPRYHSGGFINLSTKHYVSGDVPLGYQGILIDADRMMFKGTIRAERLHVNQLDSISQRVAFSSDDCYLAKSDDFDGVGCA